MTWWETVGVLGHVLAPVITGTSRTSVKRVEFVSSRDCSIAAALVRSVVTTSTATTSEPPLSRIRTSLGSTPKNAAV